jgi:diphosphomevalonate decarboxylase
VFDGALDQASEGYQAMTPGHTAAAVASPNIALIKYWGNRIPSLRVPATGSISMTMGGLETHTRVTFAEGLAEDRLILEGRPVEGRALARVAAQLDLVRHRSGLTLRATVESTSNFPSGAGIASSASAFAALTLAACAAAGLSLPPSELSRLARRGSGSACRSIFGGFAEWNAGTSDEDSYAEPIAPASHWDLADVVAIVASEHKAVSSSEGHLLADTSPLQQARVASTPDRLVECRTAILTRDFERMARVVEADSHLMHAVMMTSTPPLYYWLPDTLRILKAASDWRLKGLAVCCTIDAGPNVHCLCPVEAAAEVESRLRQVVAKVVLRRSQPGEGARLV